MAARISDIAKQATVSNATVSLVLNEKPGVGQETRERVLQIAEQLGYKKPGSEGPTPSTGTIRFLKIARHGHTVNRDHTVFIADYIDGLTYEAKVHGLKIEILSYNSTPIEEIVGALLRDSQIQGAVVLGTELSREDVMAFRELSMPIVFLDTFIDFIPFDFVDMNNLDSVYRIVEYLFSRGHRDIGMVRSSVETRNFQLRYIGFLQTMEALHFPVREEYIFDCDSTFDGAYRDMRAILQKMLRSDTNLPSALFCTNDIIASGVLKALREEGYRIPDDISIIGFDDLPSSAVVEPPLTTIAVSKQEIGKAAVDRLVHRIANPDSPAVKVVVGGILIERESVRFLGG